MLSPKTKIQNCDILTKKKTTTFNLYLLDFIYAASAYFLFFLYYLIILNEIPTQTTTTTETRITYTTSTNNQFWTLHQNGLNKTSCLIIIDFNRYYTTAISSCSLSWHNDLKKKINPNDDAVHLFRPNLYTYLQTYTPLFPYHPNTTTTTL